MIRSNNRETGEGRKDVDWDTVKQIMARQKPSQGGLQRAQAIADNLNRQTSKKNQSRSPS